MEGNTLLTGYFTVTCHCGNPEAGRCSCSSQVAVNGNHKEGKGPARKYWHKREIFQLCHKWARGLSEGCGKRGKKQQVCLEGRLCPANVFKLLKFRAPGFITFYSEGGI